MKKLKDAHVFSNDKQSTRAFLLEMLYVLAGVLIAEFAYYLCYPSKGLDRSSILMYVLLLVFVVMGYFMSRLIAYKSKFFPKAKKRECVHVVSFIILTIFILLGFILSSYI